MTPRIFAAILHEYLLQLAKQIPQGRRSAGPVASNPWIRTLTVRFFNRGLSPA
jgi:hypothetical protein